MYVWLFFSSVREKGHFYKPIWMFSLTHKSPLEIQELLAQSSSMIELFHGVASYELLEHRPLDKLATTSGRVLNDNTANVL